MLGISALHAFCVKVPEIEIHFKKHKPENLFSSIWPSAPQHRLLIWQQMGNPSQLFWVFDMAQVFGHFFDCMFDNHTFLELKDLYE